MQMPPEEASTERLLDEYGEHHLATLNAEKNAADIAAAFAVAQDGLRGAYDARRLAQRLLVASEALEDAAELEVEQCIRKVESALLAAVSKNADLDPYKAVFPRRLGGALAPRGEAQLVETKRILSRLDETAGAAEAAGATVEPLRAAHAALTSQVKAYDAASEAVLAAKATEEVARRRYRERYRQDYGMLVALFPNDPRKVESFFKKPSKTAKASKPAKGGAGKAPAPSGA